MRSCLSSCIKVRPCSRPYTIHVCVCVCIHDHDSCQPIEHRTKHICVRDTETMCVCVCVCFAFAALDRKTTTLRDSERPSRTTVSWGQRRRIQSYASIAACDSTKWYEDRCQYVTGSMRQCVASAHVDDDHCALERIDDGGKETERGVVWGLELLEHWCNEMPCHHQGSSSLVYVYI